MKRLNLIHWLRALGVLALPICGGGLLLVVVVRLMGVGWMDWVGGVVLVGVWLGVAGWWSMWRKPTRFAALAAWDERAGRKEAFASAEFFESKGGLTEGERLHVLRSERELKTAEAGMSVDLPLPGVDWRWLMPVMLLIFVFSPWLKPVLVAEDWILSDGAAEVAKEEAEKLAKELEDLEKAKGLTAEEEKRYEEVVKKAQDMASKDLQEAGDKSTREILKELEERARAAEKLAKELGGEDDRWASEEMLAEMGRHADTADLAEAVKGKEATKSANEARKVADRLELEDLTNEVEERMDKALAKTVEKADEKDVKKPVGKHFKEASERMKGKRPKDAAAEFEKLAQEFDNKAQRERAQKQMEKLAKQLRDAGSKIAGQNMAGMQKLAGNDKNGMKPQNLPMGFDQNQQMQLQKLGKSDAMRMQDLPMMQLSAGTKLGKAGEGKPLAMGPVPGMKPGKAMLPGTGSKPGAGGMVPIPGMGVGQGMGMGAGQGAGAGQGGGQGGQQAGSGSAAMGNGSSKAEAAQLNSTVNAAINAEGEVSMRAVEGEVRGEAAGRSASAERVDFVNVQEEALDEAVLPSGRRAHVKRYFDLLREQFEAGEGE